MCHQKLPLAVPSFCVIVFVAGLTSLQMLISSLGEDRWTWGTEHISRLKNLQHLQLCSSEISESGPDPCVEVSEAEELFRQGMTHGSDCRMGTWHVWQLPADK
jgi:hypothetical protein